MATFCLDNCLDTSRHAFYKVLACFWWNFIPLLHHPLPQLMNSLGWCCMLPGSLLEINPEVFNGVGIRGLGWPGHDINVIVFKPLCCLLWCWNVLSPSTISNFSKLSTTPPSKISHYCSASMIPWTSVSTPTPFHPIHPHTIGLFPPPCLTVGVVVLSDSCSPFFFQV